MKQHTPGPWHVQKNDQYPSLAEIVRADETTFDESFARSSSVEMANAHLIAAAPEMLFWLKRMREMIKTPAHFSESAYAEMIEDVEKLLSKAEGK